MGGLHCPAELGTVARRSPSGLGGDTDYTVSDIKRAWYKVEERLIREMLLSGERTDGRKCRDCIKGRL